MQYVMVGPPSVSKVFQPTEVLLYVSIQPTCYYLEHIFIGAPSILQRCPNLYVYSIPVVEPFSTLLFLSYIPSGIPTSTLFIDGLTLILLAVRSDSYTKYTLHITPVHSYSSMQRSPVLVFESKKVNVQVGRP